MKLGLYGGGFKPFHTGHFAKLLLALDESDRVLSFFGIKKQKISKKTGKPLKTHFRKFGDDPDARVFDQEMQERIVAIYEKALQDAYPGILDVVPSTDITPISNVHSMLDRFAYSQMTDEEKNEIDGENIPELIYQSGDTKSGSVDFNDVDEVTVVAGEDEINGPTYMGAINRRAARGDSRIGEKVKELADQGKIKLKSGIADQSRLVDLLRKYHPDATDDMVTVRGTAVRDYAGNQDEASLSKYLPAILPEDQKAEIIKILLGDQESTPTQQESFFMPIITDSTVLRAAVRFTAKKKITEATAKKKGEDHIPGLTEDMSLTFGNLKSLIDDVLSGRIEHVEEKMDGQNFTFTVLDTGEIRLFGKGVSETTLKKGGSNRSDVRNHEKWNENVKDAFGSGIDVVDKYLDGKDGDLVKRLFQNGKVVVEGQVMTPVNPNTIPYTENHVRFIRPFTPYDFDVDDDAYRDLFKDADTEIEDSKGREWSLGPVPKLAQVKSSADEISIKIQELQSDIDNLLSGMTPTPKTVGEYAARVLEGYVERVAPHLDLSTLSSDSKTRVLRRLATGDKKIIGKPEMGIVWPEFQKFEKMRTAHVAAAIADLEKIVQKLGSYFFDTLEFALATNEGVVAELASEVEKIKNARNADKIVVKNVDTGEISDMIDTVWATKLDTSLARVEQMDMFKKAVEGVVLRLPGEDGRQIVTKLTGMFTPVHRLVSLFRYPDRSSRTILSVQVPDIEDDTEDLELTDEEIDAVNEAFIIFARNLGLENMISEGGSSFKNTEGEKLTVPIPLSDVEPTLNYFFSNHLAPLDVEFYRMIGSTGKKSKSGDLDIVIPSPKEMDKKESTRFKNNILQGINKSLEDGDAKLVGQNIAVMFPIQGREAGYVQIDIMIDSCPESTCWLMSGTGDDGIKGVYRNLMLSYIANKRSSEADPSQKMTISFPGGLQKKYMPDGLDPKSEKNRRKWKADGGKITVPTEILKELGIMATPNSIETFDDLVDFMVTDQDLSRYLVGFEDYIQRYLADESTAEEAKKSIKYIEKVLTSGKSGDITEDFVRKIVDMILEQGSSSSSNIPFAKVNWSESLKMFPGVWENRDSASATGGKDEEGAEKAVAISENLIFLAKNGYAIEDVGDGILIKGKRENIKLDKAEALNYMLGYEVSQSLPSVLIAHVPGLEKYDLKIIEGNLPMEVKKMGSPTVLSKLGSATSRDFEKSVPLIKPLREAATIAKKFIIGSTLVDSDGISTVRSISSMPDSFETDSVADAVEILNDLFFRIQYGNSPKELMGIKVKIDSGQLPAGMIGAIKRSTLLDIGDRNALDLCKLALKKTLGKYSPTARGDEKEDKNTMSKDTVSVSADVGNEKYDGKVSLDYFYNDLIFRLFDTEADELQIDPEAIADYSESIEFLALIYPSLDALSTEQGPDAFDNFIDSLHYAGFYGVTSSHYYVVPCKHEELELYSTTQGFRALLKMKEIPSEIISVPSVKISKNIKSEKEVDLEDPDDSSAEIMDASVDEE